MSGQATSGPGQPPEPDQRSLSHVSSNLINSTTNTKTSNNTSTNNNTSNTSNNSNNNNNNNGSNLNLNGNFQKRPSGPQSLEAPARALSNADYDTLRNKTLMFFLDRLILATHEGKPSRSLHELSCLFGTRDFTRDMRQLVGASRNGLRKFLQLYPSLFTIEGDLVRLTQLDERASLSNRDYQREAVDYFTQKLLQFGNSLVPLKNLFGYRSQASQEVRHVSGKTIGEFKDFLASHQDVFEVLADDEHVLLKSAWRHDLLHSQPDAADAQLGPQSLPNLATRRHSQLDSATPATSALQSPTAAQPPPPTSADRQLENGEAHANTTSGRPSKPPNGPANELPTRQALPSQQSIVHTDPYLNKQFASSVQSCLRRILELAPARHQSAGPQSVPLAALHEAICAEPSNAAFLDMVATPDQLRTFLRMHPKLFKRFNEPGRGALVGLVSDDERRLMEAHSFPAAPYSSLPSMAGPKAAPIQQEQASQQHLPAQHRKPLVGQMSAEPGLRSNLRAGAPPFVPTAGAANQSRMAIQRSQSSLASNGAPQHLVQLHSFQARAAAHLSRASVGSTPATASGAEGQQDELRARTVDMVREATNIVSKLMGAADAVAFDCKGYNLGFNGQITLIQIAYLPKPAEQAPQQVSPPTKPDVYVFDLITNPESAYCLKPLLESEQVVKIVHDVRNKSNALYVQFGIMLNNVFDTQVANLVVQQQQTGVPAYKSRYISMSRLCEIYGDEQLQKYRERFKSKTAQSASNGGLAVQALAGVVTGASAAAANKLKDVNYWRTRPLADAMIYESTMDVYCLISGIYQNLKSMIKPAYEPLFDQLNMEGVLARIKPDEIRNVKKERKIDLEVIDLKRKLYTDTTGPIVLSNREIRLLRHVDLTDEVRQKIQQCTKVAKKLERLDLKAAQAAQADGSSLEQQPAGEQSLEAAGASIASHLSTSSSAGSSSSASSSATSAAHSLHNNNNNNNSNNNDDDDNNQTSTTPEPAGLISSEMFDELKDKIIESSSLLESIGDDVSVDVDLAEAAEAATAAAAAAQAAQAASLHSNEAALSLALASTSGALGQALRSLESSNSMSSLAVSQDGCHCQCHRSSASGSQPASLRSLSSLTEAAAAAATATLAAASTQTAATSSAGPESQSATPTPDGRQTADMGIQCDLLG